jgi:putative heme-binding domain-containing protein
MKLPHLLSVLALVVSSLTCAAESAAPFAIQPNDKVLIMGDTLLEREGSEAALETLLNQHFATIPFTVRNLSFSADLPTGVSRASFDPAASGMERIRTQLDLVKPTVAILGFGMAASLEEITYRSADPNLNADPVRYGSDFCATKFKADLGKLMDAISASASGPVRFILLAPLRHEDLRSQKPGLPDPSEHNRLLTDYTRAIRELATERNARFVDQGSLLPFDSQKPLSRNGIHPTSGANMERWASAIAKELGWSSSNDKPLAKDGSLQRAIQRKNELFFHRWRPANHTYIFGFRKREQGRNAVEIEQFDSLLEQADAAIAALKSGKPAPELPVIPADPIAPTPVAAPAFELENGLSISLWAENPLLSKPIEMNWDAKGRLWVASSPIYPQIQPGAFPTDKVFILEDTQHIGRADKTTLFADNLLIPTGVEPALNEGAGRNAAYVGASTELLLLKDSNGDGKADEREIVLSGFGTEDTHHTIHALHWGIDGRLYLSQSIYIHSHLETPWGVVRLNSGGVIAYDPRTERVEVFAKGLINNWGHQTNADGQSFLTDGAGSSGLNWAYPGATFGPFEGSKGVMPGVSGNGYPKFCSLEIIRSPFFPASWQGHAITCDFRAHRIVRFSINDLTTSEPAKSAYATSDQPDVVRTADQSFRPIDVKLGPDGALYVSDWTNPVINHGEVDFRDPRRDKVSGRIWRITSKEGKPAAWQSLWEKDTPLLLSALLSDNHWEQDQARKTLAQRVANGAGDALESWRKEKGSPAANREAAFVRAAAFGPEGALKGLETKDSASAAWEARWRGALGNSPGNIERLTALAQDPSPRVRIEATRALARIPSEAAAEAVAGAIKNAPSKDDQYLFAVKLTWRELGPLWVKALLEGRWDWKTREDELALRLLALDADVATNVLSAVMKNLSLPTDGSGPWTSLVAYAGGPEEATKVWEVVSKPNQVPAVIARGLDALLSAANRGVKPSGDISALAGFLDLKNDSIVRPSLTLAGAWKMNALAPKLGAAAAGTQPALRNAAAEGLRTLGGDDAVKEALSLLAPERAPEIQLQALAILAKVRPQEALKAATAMLSHSTQATAALPVWRTLTAADISLAQRIVQNSKASLPQVALDTALQAAREIGKRGTPLEEALRGAPSNSGSTTRTVQTWAKLVQENGNAAKGERIYHSTKMSCVQCHLIGGAGGKFGPDMSTLGASAPLDYIIESVLEPTAKVKEGYHGVNYTLTDGSSMTGIPFEENGSVIKIRVPGGMELEVAKAKIKSSEIIGSLMPAGLVEALTEEEKINLFAFLGSVGRPGAFDASNGSVARAWRITASADDAKAGRNLATALPAYSLTDGRLLAEHLEVPLAATTGEQVFAVAKFTLGAAGKVNLDVSGASAFWVDGKSAQPGETQFSAGEHVLAVALQKNALPSVLKASATAARFIAP